jgi:hypothetical protein
MSSIDIPDYSIRIDRTLRRLEDYRSNRREGGSEEIAAREKLVEETERDFPDTCIPPPVLKLLVVSSVRPLQEEVRGELKAYAKGFVMYYPEVKQGHVALLPQVLVRQEGCFQFLSPRRQAGPWIIQKRRAADVVSHHLLGCDWLYGFNPGSGVYVFHDGFTPERWRVMEKWFNNFLPPDLVYQH